MKKISALKLFIFVINISLADICLAQAPEITWQKTIGSAGYDWLRAIISTPDGGCLLGGYSGTDSSGNKTVNSNGSYDYWIVKLDVFGEIQWQKSIGGELSDNLTGMCNASDGGYILVGYSASGISGDKTEAQVGGAGLSDYWVIKIGWSGEIIWQNTIGGDDSDLLPDIRPTQDGGYLIGGSSYSEASGDKSDYNFGDGDIWLVKINSFGEIQWENAYGSYATDPFITMEITTDGSILVASEKYDTWTGETEGWLIKFDSIAQYQWQIELGGSSLESITSLFSEPLGNIMVSISSNSNISGNKTENCIGFYDYWILELDFAGNIIWQKTIGGEGFDIFPYFIPTLDSGYIFAGTSDSDVSGDKTENSFGDGDFWIIKTDSLGLIEWQKTIGGSEGDGVYGIIEVDTGIFVLGGGSYSNISGLKSEDCYGVNDYWVLQIGCEYSTWYADADGDLFGDYAIDTLSCSLPSNYVANNSDCDDTNPFIYPGSDEILDGLDNNCNGEIDEGFVYVSEISQEVIFTIFPNPNNGTFNLVYNSPLGATSPYGGPRGPMTTLEIFNTLGQQIYSQQINSPDGNINETISIQNLSSGIYFVQINNIQQKFIVE